MTPDQLLQEAKVYYGFATSRYENAIDATEAARAAMTERKHEMVAWGDVVRALQAVPETS